MPRAFDIAVEAFAEGDNREPLPPPPTPSGPPSLLTSEGNDAPPIRVRTGGSSIL
jgi:hypothetical protein